MDQIKQLEFLRAGGEVMRMHTIRMHRRENVAEHSFGVAWLCWIICDGNPTASMLMAAMAHDLPEQKFGDIPSPTKRILGDILDDAEQQLMERHNLIFEITKDEERVLKTADILDGLLTCLRERQLGNKAVDPMYRNYCSYFQGMDRVSPVAFEIFEYITEKYNECQ